MSTAQRHFVNMVRIMLITMLLSTASGHSQQSKYQNKLRVAESNYKESLAHLNGALKRDSTDERFLNLYDACKKLVDQYFTDPSLVHTRERWGRIVGESSLGDNDAKAECFYATEGITLSGSSSFLIENLCLSSNQKVEGASTPIIAGKNVSTGDLVKCHDWSTRALSARHEVDTIRRNIEVAQSTSEDPPEHVGAA